MREYVPNAGRSAVYLLGMVLPQPGKDDVRPVPNHRVVQNCQVVAQAKWDAIDLVGGSSVAAMIAYPLLSCAGVVISTLHLETMNRAVVYHAGGGWVDKTLFPTFVQLLGNPPADSLCVVYAVPKPWDDSYNRDLSKFVDFGVPTDQIVYLQKIGNMFGITSRREILALIT